MEYPIMTREEDWNCLPRIFSFFNKFAIEMFYPTIRKKGKFEIQNYIQIYLFSLIPSPRNEFLDNDDDTCS